MTVCDNCAKIDYLTCHVPDQDRSEGFKRKNFGIQIVDRDGNPIQSKPAKQEEHDWRDDYVKWKEKNG